MIFSVPLIAAPSSRSTPTMYTFFLKNMEANAADDCFYSPEFDVYPLKEKIENLEIHIFDAQEFVYKYDFSVFVGLFREFLEEFKK